MTEAEELQKRMAELMSTGRYASPEAMMLDALSALAERDFWEDEDQQKALAEGIADLDAGRTQPIEQVFDALEARMRRG